MQYIVCNIKLKPMSHFCAHDHVEITDSYTRDLETGVLYHNPLSFPKIISERIGDSAQPRSEWRQWCQTVGLLGARTHLSLMPSAYALDCNTPHTKQELVAGATHQRSAFGPGTRDAQFRSGVPHSHFATVILARSVGRGYPWPSPGT